MKPTSVVSLTVDFAVTLACFLSTTSSDLHLSSNMHLPLLLNNIASTGKTVLPGRCGWRFFLGGETRVYKILCVNYISKWYSRNIVGKTYWIYVSLEYGSALK